MRLNTEEEVRSETTFGEWESKMRLVDVLDTMRHMHTKRGKSPESLRSIIAYSK